MDVEPRPSGDRPETLDRVLCGVDGSPGGIAAVRQAVRLSAPGSGLQLVSVAAVAAAAHPQTAVALEARAALSLREAEREAGVRCESHMLIGDPVACLLVAARDHGATLVAVGSRGTSRLGGSWPGALRRRCCTGRLARS